MFEVTEIPVVDVKVGERQRAKLGDIQELADSIKDLGLLHAPCVTKDFELVAGFRRLTACRMLGWENIPVHVLETDDPLEIQTIELEENTKRADLTWSERVKAERKIHELQVERFGEPERAKAKKSEGWSTEDTANMLGINRATVSVDMNLAKQLEVYPELEKCKNKTVALKRLKEIQRQEMANFYKTEVARVDSIELREESCIDGMTLLKKESVDFIMADPPYGINLDEGGKFREKGDKLYNDGISHVLPLCREFAYQAYRVLKPNSHMIFWFGPTWYSQMLEILEDAGFNVDPVPAIWNKMQGSWAPTENWLAGGYEPFFHCRKGKRIIFKPRRNVFDVSSVFKRRIDSFPEKPVKLMEELLETFSEPGDLVLSPFCGSGADLEACHNQGRKGIGWEIDETRARIIRERIHEVTKGDGDESKS